MAVVVAAEKEGLPDFRRKGLLVPKAGDAEAMAGNCAEETQAMVFTSGQMSGGCDIGRP